jgi:chemotaxis family two-component system response regulator Rcp1
MIRILLVEDRKQDIRQVKRALKKLGQDHHPLDVVEDGADAIDFLLKRGTWTGAETQDIVILDWMLPLKNGGEVLVEMRREAHLKNLPVVVFTTSPDRIDIEAAYTAGANAYLRKPIDPDEFEQVVSSLCTFWLETVELPSR